MKKETRGIFSHPTWRNMTDVLTLKTFLSYLPYHITKTSTTFSLAAKTLQVLLKTIFTNDDDSSKSESKTDS